MDWLRKIYPLLCLVLLQCYEYEETIVFTKPFSGYVEIRYVVPLKKDKETSLIRHLPIKKEAIQQLLERNSQKSEIQIREYNFNLLEKGQFAEQFFDYKAEVSYKIDFEDIIDIEQILIGNVIVKIRGRNLSIRREFPSISPEFMDSASVGEKKIISEVSKLLKDGYLKFKVLFPISTECTSNRGIIQLGSLVYVYPLKESLEPSGAKVWEYKLKFLN